ncbi:hypothetical protein [Mucilaginibacter sp.]|uniref:hypothetical protein n=1 Tax=Mucilaginibacter sp. TaxID=1882438 RepID=UPI0035BC7DB8
MLKKLTVAFILLITAINIGYTQSKPLGIFDAQAEVGPVKLKGDLKFDAKNGHYLLSGSGSDVYFTKDELHFAYKKIKGDFTLKADAAFIGGDTHMYGKFGLMARQSLNGDAAQVNAVVHGNKLTALQYRNTAGDSTYEQRTDVETAQVLQLQRKGSTFIMTVGYKDKPLTSEKRIDLDLGDELYVGIFICSHIPDKIKQAGFSNVRLVTAATKFSRRKKLH